MGLRKAVFAGSWYPGEEADCAGEIEQFLRHGIPLPESHPVWVGGIVPHAGWYYSGQIACNVIHWLKEETPPDVVVVFGMHLHGGSSNYIMPGGAWETPFGAMPVAGELADHLLERFPFQKESVSRFVQDNTVELQLPFIKYLLNPKEILAIGAAPNSQALKIGQTVADWARDNGKRLKVIGSTDLTHYGRNYGFSPKGTGPRALDWVRNESDRRMIKAILDMEPRNVMDEGLRNQNACCSGAVAAAVAAVRQMGASVSKELAYATSYDKSPGDSFVGYVGVVFG